MGLGGALGHSQLKDTVGDMIAARHGPIYSASTRNTNKREPHRAPARRTSILLSLVLQPLRANLAHPPLYFGRLAARNSSSSSSPPQVNHLRLLMNTAR
jgi:hypothetical protein